MAVRLPSAPDLGPAPGADSTRPIATYDATGIARGADKIAAGAGNLGAGISKLGAGLEEYGTDVNRWQYTQAQADFISRKIDLDAAIGQDQSYGPDKSGKDLTARYTEQLNGIRAASGNMIQDPSMRALFVAHTKPAFEQGVVQAQSHQRALYNDAQRGYVAEMGDKAIDQAVAAKDDATRTQIIDAHNQLIDGLAAGGSVTDVQARALKQEWAHRYATADLLARADSDPQGVINELRAKPGSPEAITGRILSNEGSTRNKRSSADGFGNFTEGTWLDVIKRNRPDLAAGRSDQDLLLLRHDRKLASDMVTAYQRENAASLKAGGFEATPGNLYLAHFLGAGGAKAVLEASPNVPVFDALAKKLGPDKAKAMVDANPEVLQGKLAGSVKLWADGKMGGQAPGGGSVYDMLRPDVREEVLAHAQMQLQKQTVQDLTAFKQRLEDTQAEAMRTGKVTNPLGLSDFVSSLGAEAGAKAYHSYSADLQVARDTARVATMDPDQMRQLVDSYAPKPGEGYAAAAERQDLIRKAAAQSLKERGDDPAGFAVGRLPGTAEAYKAYQSVLGDMTASDGQRAVAARSFAATTLLEQQGAGIPMEVRQILPAADLERVKAAISTAATSDDPNIRTRLVAQIQAQKAMWGDYWPQIARQLTPSMQPIVRAVAAGADPEAMTRLLRLKPNENPAAILKEQSETKAGDMRRALNTEMASFKGTLVGSQRDNDFADYYGLGEKLAALYINDGKDASVAARGAYNALIGNRYDLRDTWRIPKDAGVSADDVQAGALAARGKLEELGARPAVDDLGGLSDARRDSLDKFKRDGVWVTDPNNSGLNLMYGGKFVKDGAGRNLYLSWRQLGELGGTPEARAEAMRAATEFGPGTP
jgi:hypothetical protein